MGVAVAVAVAVCVCVGYHYVRGCEGCFGLFEPLEPKQLVSITYERGTDNLHSSGHYCLGWPEPHSPYSTITIARFEYLLTCERNAWCATP